MKAVMPELDYDLDDDDMKFLSQLNKENKSKSNTNFFESIIC